MPNWKKLIVSGSDASLNSLNVTTNVTAQSFTGSFSGSINTAITASYALTASYVNTLNQTVIITGSLGVGVGSLGSTENTLVLGPAPAGGSGEGGQILLQAQGGTYTSASMLDNYQNKFRLLRGTNAGSDGYKLQVDLQTGQLQLPNYNSTSAFTGTTLVGLVGFDSSGNLLTTQTSSAALSGGSTNYAARWASSSTLTTGSIYDTGTNVGIGTTSPGYKLDVQGDVGIGVAGATTVHAYYNSTTRNQNVYTNNSSFEFHEGINERVRIAAGGNVGIGTTSPATKLALAGSTATTFGLSLEPSGWNTAKHRLTVPISGDVSMWSFNWDGSSVDSALYAPASILLSQGTITFNTTGSANSPAPRMTINSTGNVGIGTTSPGAKLHVASGEIRVDAGQAVTLDTSNSMYLVGASNQLRLYNGGNPIVNITTGGNVGIGTTSPSEKLHVVGDVLISDSSPSLIFTDTTNNADAIIYTLDDGSLAFSADENNEVAGSKLLFYVDGGEKVRITDGGNVGIGTSSPSYKLDVVGATNTAGLYSRGANIGFESQIAALGTNGSYQAGYYLGATNTVYAARLGMDVNSGDVYLGIGNTGSLSTVTYFKANGNVGIGTTSPSARLHISGSTDATQRIIVDGSGNNSSLHLNYNGSNVGFINSYQNSELNIGTSVSAFVNFYTNNTERMRITAAGNVGIGTTSPDTPLVVQGGTSGTGGWNRTATLSATYPGLIFNSNGTKWGGMAYDYSAAMRFWVNANNNDIFAGTLALSILNNGNIGIGNSDPGDKLVIDGTNVFARVSNSSTSNGGIKISYQNSDTHGLHLLYNPGSAISYIDNTYPISSGQVYGDMYFRQNVGGTMTTRLFIKADGGNVGIGTNSPSQKLDVAGAISVSGSVVDYEVAPALIGGVTTTNIISFTPGTHYAAFVDYVIKDASTGANQRVGTIQISISLAGAAAVMNEVTTIDIGNTSAITFAVSYGAPTWLTATNSGATPYDINYMVRYF